MRWACILLLAGAAGSAPTVAVAETPIQYFQRLIGPPARTLSNALRAPKPARVAKAATPLLSVPMPHLRPVPAATVPALSVLPNTVTEAPLTETIVIPTDQMPEPRVRPATAEESAAVLPKLAPAPPEAPEQTLASLPTEPLLPLIEPPPAARSTCGLAIASLGVTSTPLAPIVEGECGIAAPVAVASLDGGAVDFSGKAIVECQLAETLANWIRKDVEPAARRAFNGELTGLRIADSYSCRTRNNIPDAQLSEHSHGTAIDISAFRIGKRWIEVGPGWRGGREDAAFLADVWKSACGPFTTVLGPESDSYHAEHLHLDIIRRGKNGRSLYCH